MGAYLPASGGQEFRIIYNNYYNNIIQALASGEGVHEKALVF